MTPGLDWILMGLTVLGAALAFVLATRSSMGSLVKLDRNFLSQDDRARLTSIARDGLEEHRVARRANAILLLDRERSPEPTLRASSS